MGIKVLGKTASVKMPFQTINVIIADSIFHNSCDYSFIINVKHKIGCFKSQNWHSIQYNQQIFTKIFMQSNSC